MSDIGMDACMVSMLEKRIHIYHVNQHHGGLGKWIVLIGFGFGVFF